MAAQSGHAAVSVPLPMESKKSKASRAGTARNSGLLCSFAGQSGVSTCSEHRDCFCSVGEPAHPVLSLCSMLSAASSPLHPSSPPSTPCPHPGTSARTQLMEQLLTHSAGHQVCLWLLGIAVQLFLQHLASHSSRNSTHSPCWLSLCVAFSPCCSWRGQPDLLGFTSIYSFQEASRKENLAVLLALFLPSTA